jgi:hypothetical protein
LPTNEVELLEDHRHLASQATELAARKRRDLLPEDPHLALSGVDKAVDAAQ